MPEKWYVSVTNETVKDINMFKSKTWWKGNAIDYKAVGYEGVGYNSLPNDYTEITFNQFKKYVLKESIETPKEVIPEYVELLEGFDNTCTGKIFDTNQPIPQMSGWSNQWTWESIFKNNTQRSYFKPSTKEAFDAQNNPKSIEKWSVGSYGVVINSTNKRFPIGFIDKIIPATTHKKVEFENYNSYDPGNLEYSYGLEFKWFATKSEAEEFAKTLVKPVKEVIQLVSFPSEGYCKTDSVELRKYLIKRPNITLSGEPKWIEGKSVGVGWNERSHWIVSEKSSKPEYQLNQLERFFNKEEVKQPLKQAVHCKTQEEWDFVLSKFNPRNINNNFYKGSESVLVINHFDNKFLGSFGTLQDVNDYQISSFQEWCDLNGYKMKKEVKFEVGKWYEIILSSKFKHIFKFDLYNNEGNVDLQKGHYDISSKKWTISSSFNPERVTAYKELSLSEIQQYLPYNHPDKIKVDREFKIGDYIFVMTKGMYYRDILKVTSVDPDEKDSGIKGTVWIKHENSSFSGGGFRLGSKYRYNEHVRHATPEEINNHLISIGQIPDLIKQESEKYPFKPLKPGDLEWEIQVPQIKTHGIMWCEPAPMTKDNWKNKMILSINDEELSMVSVIKTNSIKQLLNIE